MCALLATAIAGLPACAPAQLKKQIYTGPVDTGPGSLTAARKFLEGRWTLESFEVHQTGKAAIKVNGQGTLLYDDFGNLTMEIHADKAGADLLKQSGIEIQNDMISTSGRTVVDMQNKTLAYVIEGQPKNATGPLAMNRLRHWQVDGDLLTLTTKDDAGNPVSVGRWRKSK
jgi:hypothetical protein